MPKVYLSIYIDILVRKPVCLADVPAVEQPEVRDDGGGPGGGDGGGGQLPGSAGSHSTPTVACTKQCQL